MPYSLYTNENNHLVQLPLAGVDPQAIEVFVEQNELIIKAKRTPPQGTLLVGELPAQAIEKRFSLDSSADPSNIEAIFKDGLLSLTIAKRSKRIDVKIA